MNHARVVFSKAFLEGVFLYYARGVIIHVEILILLLEGEKRRICMWILVVMVLILARGLDLML